MKSIEFLKNNNIKFREIHLDEVPVTAQDVERLYGRALNQVLKTLLVVRGVLPMLVIIPGDKTIDFKKLEIVTGQGNFRMAELGEVEDVTGYRIGAVTPFGIERNIKKIIDESIFDIETVNIGSGKANIGIEIKSADIQKIWDGLVGDIVK